MFDLLLVKKFKTNYPLVLALSKCQEP